MRGEDIGWKWREIRGKGGGRCDGCGGYGVCGGRMA